MPAQIATALVASAAETRYARKATTSLPAVAVASTRAQVVSAVRARTAMALVVSAVEISTRLEDLVGSDVIATTTV